MQNIFGRTLSTFEKNETYRSVYDFALLLQSYFSKMSRNLGDHKAVKMSNEVCLSIGNSLLDFKNFTEQSKEQILSPYFSYKSVGEKTTTSATVPKLKKYVTKLG